jgi:hypothetical protein
VSARKNRPKHGDDVTPDMSQRDMAAAIGISKGQLWRCLRLAEIPQDEFERRIAELKARGEVVTAMAVIRGAPAPARGRVERAQGIIGAMTGKEFVALYVWITSELKSCLRP